jgi:hypothetical protein
MYGLFTFFIMQFSLYLSLFIYCFCVSFFPKAFIGIYSKPCFLLRIGKVLGSNFGHGDLLSWLKVFLVSLSPSRQMRG